MVSEALTHVGGRELTSLLPESITIALVGIVLLGLAAAVKKGKGPQSGVLAA